MSVFATLASTDEFNRMMGRLFLLMVLVCFITTLIALAVCWVVVWLWRKFVPEISFWYQCWRIKRYPEGVVQILHEAGYEPPAIRAWARTRHPSLKRRPIELMGVVADEELSNAAFCSVKKAPSPSELSAH